MKKISAHPNTKFALALAITAVYIIIRNMSLDSKTTSISLLLTLIATTCIVAKEGVTTIRLFCNQPSHPKRISATVRAGALYSVSIFMTISAIYTTTFDLHHVRTTATITDISVTREKYKSHYYNYYHVTYDWVKNGRDFQHTQKLSESHGQHFLVGDSISIQYIPIAPTLSRIANKPEGIPAFLPVMLNTFVIIMTWRVHSKIRYHLHAISTIQPKS